LYIVARWPLGRNCLSLLQTCTVLERTQFTGLSDDPGPEG
ncbi:hypothetical protein T4D_13387, partial [Trichinella pseudospiralis]